MKILVVIPTYNERENIGLILPKIMEQSKDIEILIVDDNSPDGTANEVKEIMKEHPGIHLIEREKKEGLGRAYSTGFKWAIERKYDYIIQMDADFSHDPYAIHEFISLLDQGYDLIIGSRYSDGVSVVNWPIKRLIISYFANVYARIMTGVPVRDLTGGFKAWRQKVLKSIPWGKITTGGYGFQIETTFYARRNGFNIKEIPITFIERRIGTSKMSKRIIYEAFFLVMKLFFIRLFSGKRAD